MLGRLLSVEDVTPRLVDAWHDLASRSAEPNPCHEPELLLAAARHLDRPPSLALAVVGTEDHLMACLPVHQGRYWNRLPTRAIQMWQHPYCFLGTPLLDSTDPVAAAAGLLETLSRSRWGGLLAVNECGVGGPVQRAFTKAAVEHGSRVHIDRPFERAVARAADETPVALGGKHLKELRRLRRKLEFELGDKLSLVDRGSDPMVVAGFLKLEAAGWKGARGDALACRDEGFFRAVCEGLSAPERIRFTSLETSTRVVAMLCTIRSGDQWYWFKIAFDESCGSSSPGRQLMLDVTARLRDAPAATVFDSCADPRNETINQLWTGRSSFATLLIPLRGAARVPIDLLAAASSRRHRRTGNTIS